MKTKIILSFLSMSIALAAAGQSLENDDIYFSSKDRAKLQAARASELSSYSASSKTTRKRDLEDELAGNPTDSYSSTNYSARQTNPEFAARQNAQSAADDNGDYFVNDYKYSTASNLNNFNNNYSNWYNNSWYTPAYYGSSIYGWNSPYYGYNNPYYSPWYDPYWNYAGYSASFSYYYGNPYAYGWGGAYNYWNRPYIGYTSGWGWNLGYGYGFSNYYYGYPSTVIVVNNGESGGRRVVNGVRPSRGSVMYNGNNTVTRTRGTSSGNGSGIVTTRPIDGGRVGNMSSNGSGGNVSNNSRRSDEYYNRSWRYATPSNNGNNGNSNNSGWSNGNSNTRSRYSDYNNNGWSSPSNQGRTSSPSFNSGGFGGGGTRTHSAPSGGSGGRGRGH